MKVLLFSLILMFSSLHVFAEESPPQYTGKFFNGNGIVDGKANIYGAGKTAPPSTSGEGIMPFKIEFGSETKADYFIFPSITGEIACSDTTPDLYNNADGSHHCLGKTIADPIDGLSGIRVNRTMFLAGVFLSDDEPHDPAPITFDFTGEQGDQDVCDNYPSYSPELNQVFFIGDGRYFTLTDSPQEAMQRFFIPDNATRLYLGFVDGDGTGAVGFYDDNLGELTVDYEIYKRTINSIAVTQGLVLYYTFDNKDWSTSEIGNLDDSSGFGFHGIPKNLSNSLDDQPEKNVEFIQEGKYANAIRFLDEHTNIVIENGLPGIKDWTITTWFMCDHDHLYLHIAPETICNHFNCPPGLFFGINPSNFELSAATREFREGTMIIDLKYMGSGFYMNELEEGWHHLTAIGTNGETRFFIDGEFVGKADTQSSDGLYQIKAWILDDFRVYNRVLSLSEIRVLAEKSNALPANIFSDECIATYDSDGKLHIPCLNLSGDTDTSTLYDIILNQRPDNFTFDLDPLSIEIVNDFFDNVQ